MSVDDHGIEVLKKAGKAIVAGDLSNYLLQVGLAGSFSSPTETDAIVVTYPSSTTEVYTFKSGGVSGTTRMTLTLTYTNASKTFLSTAVKS